MIDFSVIDNNIGTITDMAQQCGIDFNKLYPLLKFDGRAIKKGIEINSKYRGKVWVKSGLLTVGEKEYPLITFRTMKHGELTNVFNGHDYAEKSTGTPVFKPTVTLQSQKPQQKTPDEIKRELRFNNTLAEYNKLPRENGTFSYLVEKFGERDNGFYNCDLRRGSDFIIYALRDHTGKINAFQKIYDKPKHWLAGGNKESISNYTGSFFVIGDESRIYSDGVIFTEGLATGLACFNARAKRGNFSNNDDLPVVVCFNADNLLNVTKSFKNRGCKNMIICADNDAGNINGNTGIYVGMKAARETGATLYYPVLANGKKCDFCDTLNAPKFQFKGSDFGFYLSLIKFAPRQKIKELSRQLAWAASKECPRFFSVDMACESVNLALSERGYYATKTIRAIIERCVNKRKEAVKQANKFTDNSVISLDTAGMTNEEIATEVLSFNKGIWFDTRGLGAGKTNLMAVLSSMLTYDNIAYICHRVGLTKDACTRLNHVNYEVVDPREYVQKIGICVNSIPKFNVHQKYRVLFIDEVRQTIEHLLRGRVEGRQQAWDEFWLSVNSADLVVCADADLNNFVAKMFKKHAGDKTIRALNDSSSVNDKQFHIVKGHAENMLNVLKSVSEGFNGMVACTSRKKSIEIYNFLIENGVNPDDVLLVHSQNRGDTKQAEFLANPNQNATKYRVIIHSPTMASGVSITVKHFHLNFLFSSGNLGGNEALQMTARNRIAKDVFISFSDQKHFDRITDEQLLIDGEGEKLAAFLEKKGGAFVPNELGAARIGLEVLTNTDLNDFANNFLLLAEINGVKINYSRVDKEQTMEESLLTKGISSRTKDKIIEEIYTAPAITELDAQAIQKSSAPTQVDSNKLNRYLTTTMAGTNEITLEDVKNHVDGKIAVVALYEVFNGNEVALKKWDEENHVTADRRYSKTSMHKVLNKLVDTVVPKMHAITEKDAQKFCNELKKNAAVLAANGLGNYNKEFKRPISTMSKFFEKFGHDLVLIDRNKIGKRERIYCIKENPVISRYATNRAAYSDSDFTH